MSCIREDSVLDFSFFFFSPLDNVSAQEFLPGHFCWVSYFDSRNAKSLPGQNRLLESLKGSIWSKVSSNRAPEQQRIEQINSRIRCSDDQMPSSYLVAENTAL